MAIDEDGDVIMADAGDSAQGANATAAPGAAREEAAEGGGMEGTEEGGPGAPEGGDAAAAAVDEGPAPPERVRIAEAAKETGNGLLKAGDPAAATSMYKEGIDLVEPLLEKDPAEIGEELQRRSTAVYVALRLNSTQACLKLSSPIAAIEHASRVLLLDKDSAKALYRRGLACMQIDTEGRLEQARADFSRVAQLDPANREAREQLQKAKERLKDLKQREKEKLSCALKGGLYQEQHAKLGKQQALYEEEVKRRQEAGEEAISFEDWAKKEKEKEEDLKKQQKKEFEKQMQEAAQQEENRRWLAENEKRKAQGLEELLFEEWQAMLTAPAPRKEEVVRTDDIELDEEEKKLLQETKSKGYYHGRLGTVLSNAAPKPQQVGAAELSPGKAPQAAMGSEWNQAGTWEEKDMTVWVKERLNDSLLGAEASSSQVTLPSGSAVAVTARVSKVKSLTGDAQIVMVRKQPRHGYNFEAELSFTVALSGSNGGEGGSEQKFSGTFSLPELADAVQPQDLRVDTKWKGQGPSEQLRPIAVEWAGKLRQSVCSQVLAFRAEYQQRM